MKFTVKIIQTKMFLIPFYKKARKKKQEEKEDVESEDQ